MRWIALLGLLVAFGAVAADKKMYRCGNVFQELMETVKTCSLGSISHALFEVGGAYRRSM